MEKYYTIGEFSKLIGKSKNTLRKWDEEGKLRPHHITAGRHRVYSETQLKEALAEDWDSNGCNCKPVVAAYCRCSSKTKEEELEYKLNVLKVYLNSKGYDFKVYKECRNELNIKGSELEKLLNDTLDGEFKKIVVQSKEDLSIVHLDMIELICRHSDTMLEIVDKDFGFNSNKFLKEALDFVDEIKL